MTKFSETKEPKRSGLLSLYLEIVKIKAQEDQQLNSFGCKALFLANSAGLAAAITFIGVLVQAGKQHQSFIASLLLFLAGAGCAVFMLIVLMALSSRTVSVLGAQLESFLKDELDLEELRSYGATRLGRLVLVGLLAASVVLFSCGVWAGYVGLSHL